MLADEMVYFMPQEFLRRYRKEKHYCDGNGLCRHSLQALNKLITRFSSSQTVAEETSLRDERGTSLDRESAEASRSSIDPTSPKFQVTSTT